MTRQCWKPVQAMGYFSACHRRQFQRRSLTLRWLSRCYVYDVQRTVRKDVASFRVALRSDSRREQEQIVPVGATERHAGVALCKEARTSPSVRPAELFRLSAEMRMNSPPVISNSAPRRLCGKRVRSACCLVAEALADVRFRSVDGERAERARRAGNWRSAGPAIPAGLHLVAARVDAAVDEVGVARMQVGSAGAEREPV